MVYLLRSVTMNVIVFQTVHRKSREECEMICYSSYSVHANNRKMKRRWAKQRGRTMRKSILKWMWHYAIPLQLSADQIFYKTSVECSIYLIFMFTFAMHWNISANIGKALVNFCQIHWFRATSERIFILLFAMVIRLNVVFIKHRFTFTYIKNH